MTVHIIRWLNSDASFVSQFQAFPNKQDAKRHWKTLAKEAETNADITIAGWEDDYEKVTVSTKEELINLINSLSL